MSAMATVVHKVGDDVSTDAIYPGRFMATVLPSETPQFCFADDKAFNAALQQKAHAPGSVIVAGQNFGCGSSREQAASTLKGHGLVVIARGFARIFLQNSINLGLRTVICPTVAAELGDEIELTATHVRNVTRGAEFPIVPLPAARQAIIDAGGLIAYTRSRLVAGRAE
jgi:3-isopropylmalate/(R)-2-methylmalate dehydratase small subunit